MSSLSHIIRSFNRFELKYLVTLRKAENFKRALNAYLQPDGNGNGCGAYELASLYFDSPDYRCYWEKVDGIKFRRKLRIRRYGTGAPLEDETPVFVEIKQRVDRVTQKRRALLPYREALRLCYDRDLPEHETHDAAVIEEIATLLWQYNLHPASLIQYRREAWIGSDYDIGLRVTFDTEMRYHTNFRGTGVELDDTLAQKPLFPPEWVIVEIKVNERIPYWLTELVASHNLSLVRVSKYCRSIELAQNTGNLEIAGGTHHDPVLLNTRL
ncbi:MAG: polyphosphate polymerase domain-containing protein [Anaerolineae bacterium]|jgi:SPX domain protein involved in polyphosphate accumulation|nr:polyphosphate polymerase domain-containing protein [Anaerolineae bacterium]